MQRYLIRRLLLLIPTLFLASILIFAIIALAPGDPARMMLGANATPEEIAVERTRLGLDDPRPGLLQHRQQWVFTPFGRHRDREARQRPGRAVRARHRGQPGRP